MIVDSTLSYQVITIDSSVDSRTGMRDRWDARQEQSGTTIRKLCPAYLFFMVRRKVVHNTNLPLNMFTQNPHFINIGAGYLIRLHIENFQKYMYFREKMTFFRT